MAASTVLSEEEARTVKRLLASTANSLTDTLGSLIDLPVVIKPGNISLALGDDLLSSLDANYAVIRGALDKDFAGKTLRILTCAPDATTLAASMMMTPEEVIAERRKSGNLDGEDLEAFGEVGNILCSGIDSVLRDKVKGAIGLRLQDHGVVRPGVDDGELLGDGSESFFAYTFTLQIGSYPDQNAYLLIDADTAEAWNGKPFLVSSDEAEQPAPTEGPEKTSNRIEWRDEAFEDIPAADIRGRLACFVTTTAAYDIVRRSCRRSGLELERRARGEVPNPAAHRGSIVLIDVPVGEDRRFDWCKRIKAYADDVCVVLLIHMPSRSRVLRGFMSRANAILAWPATETDLSARLTTLLDSMTGGTAAPPPSEPKDDDKGENPEA